MTRHVRSWAIAALAAFALAGAAAPSFAGITYNVTNYLDGQSGWSVNGTITVSRVGRLESASDFTAWDITMSKDNAGSYRFANTLPGQNSIGLYNYMTASTRTLVLPPESNFGVTNTDYSSIMHWNPNPGDPVYQSYIDYQTAFYSSSFSPSNNGAWTIGTVSPSGVPEIDLATGGSALSLVAGVLAMIEQRRRRATLVA